jgi:hypothetical protein
MPGSALPERGRYVDEPACFDEHGLRRLPPAHPTRCLVPRSEWVRSYWR